jgi:signal transduction histidine kinase
VPRAPRLVLFSVAYFLAAELGRRLTLGAAGYSTFWPASGVYAAALLAAAPRSWPAVALAALPANLASNLLHGTAPALALAFFAGNTLESLAGAWAVRRVAGGRPSLARLRDAGALIVLGAACAPALAAGVGAAALAAAGAPFGSTFLGWWSGSVLGVLLVVPPVLAGLAPREPRRGSAAEALALSLALAGSLALVAGHPPGAALGGSYLLLPPLVWSALRCGPRGATAAALAVSAGTYLGTRLGLGDFGGLPDAGGALQLFLAVVIGTQLVLVATVEERQEAARRAEGAARLAGVGTLVAGVAHEVNNPLAYVMANVEAARERLAGHAGAELDEARAALGDAATGAERIRLVVRSLRLVAREQEERPGPVDPAAAIRAALDLVRNELHSRARTTVDVAASRPVLGSEHRLVQVIANLLDNAAQAIAPGAPDRNEVAVRLRAAAGRVTIEVSDTGSGMTDEVRARVFEPYFTTKPLGVGTGLGLAISHGIVAAMGGTIEVESAPGRGSTFRVTLPEARGA